MAKPSPFPIATAAILFAATAATSRAEEKVTYDDNVTPILRNSCFKCHNPDKAKGDLDLTTFSAVMKGGGSGKAVSPGDASGSKLFKAIAHAEEPFMPANSPKLPDAEIDLIRRWIGGGLLEKSSSKALASDRPKVDLALGSAVKGKPEGPVAMPLDWLLEPVVRTERPTAITALAASPWAPLIAIGGQHQVFVYHSDTRELLGVEPLPDGNPNCLRFSRNGGLLLVGGGHGAKFGFVDVFDVTSGARVVRVGNEYDTVLAADISADQSKIALGGPTRHVKVFSTRDGQLLHDVKKHTDWVTAIEYSPDSVLLATGDRNGGLVVWEAESGQEFYTLGGHKAAITAVSWRDNSDIVLSASEDGSVKLWEMREGREVKNWTAHKDGVLDARFTHDGRIVTCGRDNQIVTWTADGNKLKNFDFGGELPVRATFSHDGTNVITSSWWGRIGIWGPDGKRIGDVPETPPTIAERFEAATKVVAERQATSARAAETLATEEAEAAKIKLALDTHDKTSPVFEYMEAQRQAQAANRKTSEETTKELEKLKAIAAKSATVLAITEADVAKIEAAIAKTEKFSEPYKQLSQQLDTANQKVVAAIARSNETARAVTERAAAAAKSASDFVAKIKVATEAAEKATASVHELTRQIAAANKTATDARATAEIDKARVVELQSAASQKMALLTAAEGELASLNKTLETTDNSAGQSQDTTKQTEASKKVGDAKAAHEASQRALGDMRAAAEKSTAALAAADAELTKLSTSLETAQKNLLSSKENVTKLETDSNAAAETAKKEITSLQSTAGEAVATLNAVKDEASDIHGKRDKTEQFSDAYKEMMRQLEAAKKKVAEARVPAEHDQKEVVELQAAAEKIAAAIATAEAEAAKVKDTLARSDPNYQHYNELEKQFDIANKKTTATKEAANKADHELTASKTIVAQLKVSQSYAEVYKARQALSAKQRDHDKLLAALAAAQEDNARAAKDLAAARKALDAAKAQTDSAALLRQIERHAETVKTSDTRIANARVIADRSARELAIEKGRLDQLIAEYNRLKSPSVQIVKQANTDRVVR